MLRVREVDVTRGIGGQGGRDRSEADRDVGSPGKAPGRAGREDERAESEEANGRDPKRWCHDTNGKGDYRLQIKSVRTEPFAAAQLGLR